MERVGLIMEDPFYQECLAKNKAAEVTRKYCKHDFQHMLDVARIAYILCLEAGDLNHFMADNKITSRAEAKEIIYATGIVHDLARWKEYAEGGDHSVMGAELAKDVLERCNFNQNEIRIITSAIREHRSIGQYLSILGEKIYRADNLSRICTQCEANVDCYKFNDMETGQQALVY